MRFQFKGFLVGFIIAAILFTSVPTFAQGAAEVLEVVVNKFNVMVDGNIVGTVGDNYTLDNGVEVPLSMVYRGTTYMPLRKVSEILGKGVGWDSNTQTVSINSSSSSENESSS